MYKCNKCGDTVDTLRTVSEYLPYGNGFTAREDIDTNCGCGGTMENAEQCQECGEWFFEEEMSSGVCEECFEKLIDDYSLDVAEMQVRNGYKNDEWSRNIELPQMLIDVLGQEQIKKIVEKEFIKIIKYKDEKIKEALSEYFGNDDSWYIDKVEEFRKEAKNYEN